MPTDGRCFMDSRSKDCGNGGLLAACFARFVGIHGSLMEIPEVVSVRKPLTRQRTLTLENDG